MTVTEVTLEIVQGIEKIRSKKSSYFSSKDDGSPRHF